ncbi:hypothetical protein ACFV2H_01600 [Streptomyces sp. NPDC059629]|uniref:hypothetical protein n=1 Tax=Streptomyces sp. NPDC059629 TaxID=3346889 RepID=UPI0036A7C1C0
MTDRLPMAAFGDRRAGEFSFREHLELIRTRPGMYGLDGSYGNYVTYLYGYDAGPQGGALLGSGSGYSSSWGGRAALCGRASSQSS